MTARTLLSVAFAAALVSSSASIAQTTALTRATVIDGSGAAPMRDYTIVMERGRIREMGPSSSVKVPAGATVVDLTGKFIVPGIINAHGHVASETAEPELRQYALYGITTAVNQGTDKGDALVKIKREQQAGNLRGARVMTTMWRFDPNPDVATPEQARAKVDEIVAQGADLVKVWVEGQYGTRAKIAPDVRIAVLDQARKHGKVTTTHIYEIEDARMMIEAGVNILAHAVRDREVDAGFIALMKQRNITLIPTLTRDEGLIAYAHTPPWIEEEFFRKSVPPERMEVLRTKVRDQQRKSKQTPLVTAGFEMNKINLKKLSDAGVRIAFGTDSGGPADRFFVQGYFEHREMELMVLSGMTPMQVIQAFSKNSAEALRIDKDYGTLARGKAADLLVLEKNPLEDIKNMRTMQTIYLGGRKFE
jgi:imidazolonepropionase-like amidohydrolase